MVSTPPADFGDQTSRQLIQNLLDRGLTRAEIAAELDRDPRTVGLVLGGQRPGTNLRETLLELNQHGQAVTPPPRRRTKTGDTAKIRGRAGAPAVAPPAPRPPSARGKFSISTAYLADGQRLHSTQVPKTEGPGRQRARDALLDQLRGAARGRRRVGFRVTMGTGRMVELGRKSGYRATDALRRSRAEGDDPLSWLGDEAENIYDELGGEKIVHVTMRVW